MRGQNDFMKKMGIMKRKTVAQPSGKNLSGHRCAYSRGYVYTLEVMLAVASIMLTLVLMFSAPPEEPEAALAVMKQSVYDALFYMDQSDDLRAAVASGGVESIDTNLTAMLPSNIVFDTNICSVSCNSSSVPSNRTVVTVDYYVSGHRETFMNKKVRVWIWQKF